MQCRTRCQKVLCQLLQRQRAGFVDPVRGGGTGGAGGNPSRRSGGNLHQQTGQALCPETGRDLNGYPCSQPKDRRWIRKTAGAGAPLTTPFWAWPFHIRTPPADWPWVPWVQGPTGLKSKTERKRERPFQKLLDQVKLVGNTVLDADYRKEMITVFAERLLDKIMGGGEVMEPQRVKFRVKRRDGGIKCRLRRKPCLRP